MTLRLSPLLTALLVLVPLAACHRNRPQAAAVPTSDAPPLPTATDDRDRLERERLERERLEREAAERTRLESLERALAATVHFAFDRYDLSEEARTLLAAKWEVLVALPALRLRIEGHADELGSDEYNLALGLQRAAAVKRFFTQRDIADDRFEIVSRGEEQRVCQDPVDSCRARNRRAEFHVIEGLGRMGSNHGS
ncbi:MAG TPA: OmpA family protein [Gemmatimonadaceae bacterium]|nr:OmpA family protein [Gemmatimonadaceae bacterium]